MALPTFAELLQAYQTIPGMAGAVEAGQKGVQTGTEMAAAVQARKVAAQKAASEAELSHAQAGYYGRRDPLTEAMEKAKAMADLEKTREAARADIEKNREAGRTSRHDSSEAGKTQRTGMMVGAQEAKLPISAASTVAKTKPTKETFFQKAAQFVSHPIDALTKPTPPTPQAQAVGFLQSKFQQPAQAPAAAAPAAQSGAAESAPDGSPVHTYPSGRKVKFNSQSGQWEPFSGQ